VFQNSVEVMLNSDAELFEPRISRILPFGHPSFVLSPALAPDVICVNHAGEDGDVSEFCTRNATKSEKALQGPQAILSNHLR
jgi:hypothetical protein